MKSTFKWGVAAVLLAVAGGGALMVLRGKAVGVVPVTRGAIVQSVVATGRVNAPARIDVGAEVTATVLEVKVREGDRVQAGQTLVRLQDAEARAALVQARGALVEARERRTQQASVAAPVADEQVLQAEALWRMARLEHERARDLVAKGFYAQQKLDDAQRALDTAGSALSAARVQARSQQRGGVESQLSESRVEQAQAAERAAQARLDRLQLKSPVAAMVLSRNAEPGSLAQPGRVLLTLAAQGITRLDVAVDERYLRLLQPGLKARAVADAYPGQPFDARLYYVAPAVDATKGSVEVRLEVPEPPPFLRPDMTVSVELLAGESRDALVLPSEAVRDADGEAPWVLAVRDGRAQRVPVKLGLRGVGSVQVTQGVAEGDLTVPQTEKVLPGDRVRPEQRKGSLPGFQVPSFVAR